MLEQLDRYRARPEEADAHRLMHELARDTPAPMARDQFDPGHLTVGAFVLAESHLLMIHHRRLDMWIEPGGHVDSQDATLEAAAARELLEETGVTAQLAANGIFDLDVHTIPAARGEPQHLHYNVGYLFTAERVTPVAAPEVRAARWVPLEKVATLNTDAAIHRAVAKLQAL